MKYRPNTHGGTRRPMLPFGGRLHRPLQALFVSIAQRTRQANEHTMLPKLNKHGAKASGTFNTELLVADLRL